MNIYPIQFAIPESKIPKSVPEKSVFFSDLSPLGGSQKYQFFIEDEYYAHYGKSHFAVTVKKAGWDCLRHYEILASGSLPYFMGIENCPENTLFAWPKDLLLQVKMLPGMPSERKVLKAAKRGTLHKLVPGSGFDLKRYWSLHKSFMRYFHEKLTSKYLAEYFLKALGIKGNANILLCFGVEGSSLDYMRDLLISALAKDAGVSLCVYPVPVWQFKSCSRDFLNTLYGRGFSCTATLDPDDFQSPEDWGEVSQNLDDFDAIIACTSSNHGFGSLPEEVREALSLRSDIVWVDGNDISADHAVPACADRVFRREMN